MFRPSCRSSSPLSFMDMDMDMWDARSRFMSQSSAWCGMAAMSGSGFLSKVSTSTCGSTSGFRQIEPGLRKWQSLSHLEPDTATRPFPPSPGDELRAARGERGFRQAGAGQWMQEERLDTQLKNRNSQLNYNKTTVQLHDMKHQEKEETQFTQFVNRQRGELQDKVLLLEKELTQLRSSFGRRGDEHPNPATFKTFPQSQGDLNIQGNQKVDTELHMLREALREAEVRVKTREEERNQALQKLQTSTETQRTLLNQMDEMNQRLSHMRQNHSALQEQLSDANNKISQACLEKAILSTQALKLEENIKDLKNKLSAGLTEKDKLIQEKADLQQKNQVLEQQLKHPEEREVIESKNDNKQDQDMIKMKEESNALKKVNEKLTQELEMLKHELTTSQSNVEKTTAEKDVLCKQTADLSEECSQLIREKDKLLSEGKHEDLTAMKETCCQLRETVEALESEKLKLLDQRLCFEARILEKEEKLQLLEEEYHRQDAARVRIISELKAVASHWTEKWQKAALTLEATQKELKELKQNKLSNGRECDSLLKVELDACRQELELERSRNQLLNNRLNGAGATQNEDTETELSESSLFRAPPSDHQSSPSKASQGNGLNPKPSNREEELDGKEKSLNGAEGPVKADINNTSQATILALEHKDGNGSSSVEAKADKSVCPFNPEMEQQRRLITEQLKSRFKEREDKEAATVGNGAEAAQTGGSSLLAQSNTAKNPRKSTDRRIWAQVSGLMPVFEEDEESSEEAKPTGVAAEMFDHSKDEGISDLKAKCEILLQGEAALKNKQPVQAVAQTTEELPNKTSDVKEADVSKSSDVINLQKNRLATLYPDGIFTAELVDICSPDEDEEGGVDK